MAGPTVLWDHLEQLRQLARDLRKLSEEEPLRKARPDYPRARLGRSHDDEVRRVLEGISAGLDALEQLVPQVLEDGGSLLGLVPEETPPAVLERVRALKRLAASLAVEAFQPPPPLPAHAPAYLYDLPGHDRVPSKAVTLSTGVEAVVGALRNAVLRQLNAEGRPSLGSAS